MKKIIEGVMRFRSEEFPARQSYYEQLAAKQQRPEALFITCADSRVMPNTITQTEPGVLFQLRNAGNLVPPHGAADSGEAATIEYATEVLNVRSIIICGHSQCGVIRTILDGGPGDHLPALQSWFGHAEATRRIIRQKYAGLQGEALQTAAAEENVLVQMNNLSTHPCVAALLSAGRIKVFGWYYDIGRGTVMQFDQALGRFVEIHGPALATATVPIRSTQVPEVAT